MGVYLDSLNRTKVEPNSSAIATDIPEYSEADLACGKQRPLFILQEFQIYGEVTRVLKEYPKRNPSPRFNILLIGFINTRLYLHIKFQNHLRVDCRYHTPLSLNKSVGFS